MCARSLEQEIFRVSSTRLNLEDGEEYTIVRQGDILAIVE